MEYNEAVARMRDLKIALGSGLRGAEYKAALEEYMALKRAIAEAKGQQSSGGEESSSGGDVPWWQQRDGPSLL